MWTKEQKGEETLSHLTFYVFPTLPLTLSLPCSNFSAFDMLAYQDVSIARLAEAVPETFGAIAQDKPLSQRLEVIGE